VHKSMRLRMQPMLGLVALLTVLGLVVVACGGKVPVPQMGKGTAAGGQEARVDLPKFPKAPSDAVNPRVRGSQNMTLAEFVQWAIVDADAKWQAIFADASVTYTPVYYYIFPNQTVDSECGLIKPQQGALYCHLDQTVFYPLSYEAKSAGDFAVATAAAHELGHHVQNQSGIWKLRKAGVYTTRQLELQADCFSGVWAYSVYSENLLNEGDVKEAMDWNFVIGDLPGTSPTDPTAHGSPTERVEAFLAGYNSGDPGRCFDYTPTPEETTTPEEATG
jgi:uncharacterized protein